MTAITVDRAVLEQALKALEQCGLTDTHRSYEKESAAKAALRAALAQQEQDTAVHMTHCNQGEWEGVCKYGEEDCPALAQQEPVAYLYSTIAGVVVLHRVKRIGHAKPLYFQAQLENDIKGAREYPNAHSVVALYTTPPCREWVSLTEEEILKAIGWERAEMYMKLAPNFPVDEAKQETLKNARAVERAVWEKNHG
jgi:ATP-dependent helicase YprA (DUF1998 family)